MKRATVFVMILLLLVIPLAARALSLSDLGDKPEPAPRTMPEPTVVNVPLYNGNPPDVFLGKVALTSSVAGLGYEYRSFSPDPWKMMQALIKYNNRLIAAGYDSPSFKEFEGEKQQYLYFSKNGKPSVYLLPYLKENSLIAVIKYDSGIVDVFPEDADAGEAYAALAAELDSTETREKAAEKLAAIWKTEAMKQAITEKITAENMDALLPVLIRKDYFTRFNEKGEVNASSSVSDIGGVLRGLIGSQESMEDKLSLVRKIAAGILPLVDERYLEISSIVQNNSNMQGGDVAEALPAFPEFDSEAKIPDNMKDDGAAHKYVVVSENSGNYHLMPYHSLFLPSEEIAESLAEADRVIVCHNYYKKSSGNWIGGTPSDSMTRIFLYGAEGSLICSLGSAGNYQGVVSHGGLPHDWIEMGEVIARYFAEK
ncbi:MAG: hypothetical protein K5746_01780 [Clostridiales bacterium]|nr:hypothetical protein [Clostridiales bacterium]